MSTTEEYIPPDGHNVNFTLVSYTVPDGHNVDFDIYGVYVYIKLNGVFVKKPMKVFH